MAKKKVTQTDETEQSDYLREDESVMENEIEEEQSYDDTTIENTPKTANGKKGIKSFLQSFGNTIFTVGIFIATIVLFILSAFFIKPTGNVKSSYIAYYIIYLVFAFFVIVFCFILRCNTYSMSKFYKNFVSKNGTYSSLDSNNGKIKKICEAYKNSFIVSGDEDYHKTRANSDLYFGVDTWLQDLNIIPLQTFLKIIPGTFIGFGILGTFIGFSAGLTNIKVIDGDMQSITTGVQSLLDGLKNAFNTSIVGVLASVYLNFFVIHPFLNQLNSLSEQLCDCLDSKFYATEVDAMAAMDENHNPVPFPVMMNDLMAKIQRVDETVGHLGNKLGAQISESLKTTLDDSIESIIHEEIKKFKEEFKTLNETLSACSAQLYAAPQNLKEASGIMKETSTISVSDFQKQSQESIAALTKTINDNLNTKFESYLETLTSISNEMVKVNNIIDKLPENFLSVAESIDTTSQKIVNNSETFSQAFDNSTKALAQTTEITSKIADSYKSQISIIEDSANQIEKVINESNQVTKNSKDLLDGYTSIDEHIASIFTEVNTSTEKYSSILSQSLIGYFKQFQEATKDISKQFADAISQLSEEIDKLNSGR